MFESTSICMTVALASTIWKTPSPRSDARTCAGLGTRARSQCWRTSRAKVVAAADSAAVAPSPPGRADGAAGPGTGVVGPAAGGATEAGVGVVVLDTAGTSVLGTAGGVVVGAAAGAAATVLGGASGPGSSAADG